MTSIGETGTTWAIDWTSRRTWLRFAALTLYLSGALIVAVLGAALVGNLTLGPLEPNWLNFVAYFVPAFAVWWSSMYLFEKLLKYPSYVADLDVLTMDRSLITPSRFIWPWSMCISGIAVIAIVEASRLLGIGTVLPASWLIVIVVILVLNISESHLVWTLRKFLGEALPTERTTREAAVWNRIGPISIVWNLFMGVALLFLLLIALN